MNIVCLLNGATAVRERSSDEIDVQPCGCASTPIRWMQMCREHGEPCEALHVQARTDHDRNDAIRELTS